MNKKLYLVLLSSFFVGGLQAMAPVPANGALNAAVVSGMSCFLPQCQLSDQVLRDTTLIKQLDGNKLWIDASCMPIQKPRMGAYAGFRGLGAPTRVLYQQKTRDEGVYKQAYDEAYTELKKSRDPEKTLKKLRVKYHPDRCKGDHSGAEAVIDANNKLFASKNNKVNSEFADVYKDLGKQRLKELLCKNSILQTILRWGLPEKELLWSQRDVLIQELEQFIKNHFELINMVRSDDKKFDPNKTVRDITERQLILKAHVETQEALLHLYPELRHRIKLHFEIMTVFLVIHEQILAKPFGVYSAKEYYKEPAYNARVKLRIFFKWFALLTAYGTYKIGSKMYRYLTTPTEPVTDEQKFEKSGLQPAKDVSKKNRPTFVEPEEEMFMPA